MKSVDYYKEKYYTNINFIIFDEASVIKKDKNYYLENILCKKHNLYFNKATSELKRSSLCPKCGRESSTLKRTQFNFQEKAIKVHRDKYDYSLVEYKNNQTKIKIICSKHGEFEQRPNDHLRGYGCNTCRKEVGIDYVEQCKFYGRIESTLYVIRLYNEVENFLKVGITVNLNTRFYSMPYKYEIIHTITSNVESIHSLEQKVHQQFKNNKYNPSIHFGGLTECYNLEVQEDILNFVSS